MSKRILKSKADIFMDFATNLSRISKCEQRGVAAIITDETLTQVYSIGINGGPAGGADCLCALPGKETCIHAEAQAIAKNTSPDKRKAMFCTLSPCVTCASLIVNTGFIAVYVSELWKDVTGLAILQSAGIKVYKANEKRKWLPWVSK